ncbi:MULTISPECIES: hypothetical protein [unclassified Arthrobacter]
MNDGNFGWNALNSLIGSGDLNGDSKNDPGGRMTDGTPWAYRGVRVAV